MRTFEECRDEIAKKWGYNSWYEIDFYALDYSHHEEEWYQEEKGMEEYLNKMSAKLYAEYCIQATLKDASERLSTGSVINIFTKALVQKTKPVLL